jgi:ribosomal protein L14
MIFPETFLELMDNSNARYLQCIQVLNKSRRKPASIGDCLVVCIKDDHRSETKTIKGKVFRSIVITIAKKKKTSRWFNV